jgi:hypothetical protein
MLSKANPTKFIYRVQFAKNRCQSGKPLMTQSTRTLRTATSFFLISFFQISFYLIIFYFTIFQIFFQIIYIYSCNFEKTQYNPKSSSMLKYFLPITHSSFISIIIDAASLIDALTFGNALLQYPDNIMNFYKKVTGDLIVVS